MDHRYIHGEERAYRRGLVFGFSMAETVLLVLFVLLLATAAFISERESEAQEAREALVGRERMIEAQRNLIMIQRLEGEALRSRLAEIEAQIEPSGRLDDLFTRLTRATTQLAAVRAENAALEQARRQTEKDAAAAAAAAVAEAAAARRRIAELERALQAAEPPAGDPRRELRDMRNENMALRARIGSQAGGRGSDHPSCWYDAAGRIQYVFSITLSSAGLSIADVAPADRRADLAALPVGGIRLGTPISAAAFTRQTHDLYRWSAERGPECRFFVQVVDRTGADAKSLYKDLLRSIEGHFYKLEIR